MNQMSQMLRHLKTGKTLTGHDAVHLLDIPRHPEIVRRINGKHGDIVGIRHVKSNRPNVTRENLYYLKSMWEPK